MKLKVLSNPYVVGAAVGIFFGAMILVSVTWAPKFWDETNNWWHKVVFFGVGVLTIMVLQFWRFRRHPKLWGSLVILIAMNVVAVLIFLPEVRQMTPGGYIPIIFCESFLGFVVLDWVLSSKRRS